MKLEKLAGATSEIWQIFVRDSSSTTGGGLTGLAFNTASLTAYYHRDTDTTATAIALVTMTVGTFTSSGFKEIDATNMPGWYQFCPPNAAIASGAKSCAFHLKGATNMAPLPIEVQLTAINPDSATAFMTSVATVTTATNLTNAPTNGDLTATMKTSVTTAATAATPTAAAVTGNVGGNVVGSVASVVASVTLAASAVQAIWDALTSALTTVGSIGKLLVTNIDAAISTRLAAASYTAPDNTSITAIKAKTDSLTYTVAGKLDINILYVNGIQVKGSGTAGDPWNPV